LEATIARHCKIMHVSHYITVSGIQIDALQMR